MRYFEDLAKIATLKPRVEKTVSSSDPLKLDQSFGFELLKSLRPFLTQKSTRLYFAFKGIFFWITPHLKILHERKILAKDFLPDFCIFKLGHSSLLEVHDAL